jgi:hypothetical protein
MHELKLGPHLDSGEDQAAGLSLPLFLACFFQARSKHRTGSARSEWTETGYSVKDGMAALERYYPFVRNLRKD